MPEQDLIDEEEGTEDEYDDSISQEDIDNLISRAEKAESNSLKLSKTASAMDHKRKDSNILHLQISTEEMLTKLEHFYRGDVWKDVKGDGEMKWVAQTNKELITFNEFGVTSFMEIITKYIDRNTVLSYYSEQRIFEILGDLGDELVLFLLCNYAKLGMDTYFKKTKFRMMITTTLHVIESTYRRALRGKTLEEINQSRVIGQFGEIPNQIMQPQNINKNKFQKFLGF